VKILVTGGGTGGHVAPALAVIQELQRRDPKLVFQYIGSESGVEAKLVREAQINFTGVASGKLRRSSKGILGLLTLANLKDAFRIPIGVLQSLSAVKAFRPDVVFATGGYVSVPPVIAAAFLRIPILTHEQTVTIGLANKINGRFATRIALTFDGARAELSSALQKKAFVTGNPVRKAIFEGSKKSALSRFGFDPIGGLPCVYVTGGAQGSRVINNAIKDVITELTEHCLVLHQCGKSDADALIAYRETLTETQKARWNVRAFVEASEIGDAYAIADVILGRAGAGTVTEACALGKPAIFVPLVPASGDEQTRNAQRSVDASAAIIIKQSECSGEVLRKMLLPLLKNKSQRDSMGERAKTLSLPNAASDLADAILALGQG
jgi:UDP-N-acetylglucosamine--N-acetylmuramyl-(pentapeptide) pyrophosphoryl-undecaprenol N-acetylglucosamine transferase